MNLRCFYCQTPFTLGQTEKLSALQKMQNENLQHYDAYCPNCRRANPVSRERLEIFTPGWQQALQQMGQGQAPTPPAPRSEPMMPERRPEPPAISPTAPKTALMAPMAPAKAAAPTKAAKKVAKKAAKKVAKKAAKKAAKKPAKKLAKKKAPKKKAPKKSGKKKGRK